MSTTRLDLCKYIARELNFREKDVREVIDLFIDTTVNILCDDKEKVILQGFASFEPVKIPPRVARNPKSGETVHVDECYRIRCKYSCNIKERLRGDTEDGYSEV